jgi:hypothetical protein
MTAPRHTIGGRVLLALTCLGLVATSVLPAACASIGPPTAAPPAADAAPSASDEAPTPPAVGDTPDARVSMRANRAEAPASPSIHSAVADGIVSWAYLDRATGVRFESDNAATTSYTESMVKAWLAADDLNRAAQAGAPPDYDLLVPMLVDSDDNAAETVWLNNGADESIDRMIQFCGLADTQVYPGWWSMTLMSARDAVTLGQCIADGTAAGPGTDWLLSTMREVRGEGRFGVVDALPSSEAESVAIKNGWTLHYDDGQWRVNCLAIHPEWVIAVMSVYPGTDADLPVGAQLCTRITLDLLQQTTP